MVELMSIDYIVVFISIVIDWVDIDWRVDDKICIVCFCGWGFINYIYFWYKICVV